MIEHAQQNLFEDPYDKIKFDYLYGVLRDYASKNCSRKKWLISKDATGSCFQHLIKILGANTPESLKWCNLQSEDTWYDPYSYIIDEFKKSALLNRSTKMGHMEFDRIFSRKYLKKTIMTENYAAGENTC